MEERSIFNNDKRIITAVMNALRYYSLFEIPLKADEIYTNLPVLCSLSKLLVVLEDLADTSRIFQYNGYYSTDPEVKQLVLRRIIACN